MVCYLENHGEALFKLHSFQFRINSDTETLSFQLVLFLFIEQFLSFQNSQGLKGS